MGVNFELELVKSPSLYHAKAQVYGLTPIVVSHMGYGV